MNEIPCDEPSASALSFGVGTINEHYIHRMSKPGEFGDGIMLACACRLFQLPIFVVPEDGRIIKFMPLECANTANCQPVYLGYMESSKHYVRLSPIVTLDKMDGQTRDEDSNNTSCSIGIAHDNSDDSPNVDVCAIVATDRPSSSQVSQLFRDENDACTAVTRTSEHVNSSMLQVPVLSSVCHDSSTTISSESTSNVVNKRFANSGTTVQSTETPGITVRNRGSTFEKYDWLERVPTGYMCKVCRKTGLSSQQNRGAWVTNPVLVESAKKLYLKADKHAHSVIHRFACASALQANRQSESVSELVCQGANRRDAMQTDCMKSLFRAAHFLFLCEIPHTTNWRALVSTIAACDSSGKLQKFLVDKGANAHHLSSTSVTGILEAYGDAVSLRLKSKVGHCPAFSVMADECTNCNAQEMISVCIRMLRDKEVQEVFLGCWPLASTKAVAVYKCMLDALAEYDLNPADIVAASFDGASNMSGQHGGVQALLKNHAPNLIFVHCRSHVLQLALVKSCNSIPPVKRIIGILNKLYSFFSAQPSSTEYIEDGRNCCGWFHT